MSLQHASPPMGGSSGTGVTEKFQPQRLGFLAGAEHASFNEVGGFCQPKGEGGIAFDRSPRVT